METSRVFVKGLPPNLSEVDFRRHFSSKGREVTDVKLIPQRRIGYVGFKSSEDASKAVKYFHKSYIRMSKISVEPARPISEPAPIHAHNDHVVFAPSRDRKVETSFGEDHNSKKRKREETARSDAKLQEYLQVMKSGRESVIANETEVSAARPSAKEPEVLVPEDESDDEYVEVPNRQEKQRKIDHPKIMTQQDSNHKAVETAVTESAESPAAAAIEQKLATPPSKEATDDDWLRSRTSRLLDLVDADEVMQKDLNSITLPIAAKTTNDESSDHDDTLFHLSGPATEPADQSLPTEDAIARTARLFVRNLAYTVTEHDLRECFERFGNIEEVHIPVNATGSIKGFALILFANSSDAVQAFQSMDGAVFQGRILHIIPASARRDNDLDEFGMSNLPLKKQNLIRKKKEAATTTFNWNSLYMNQDAVNTSVATRLGVSKSDLLDPTSADGAVKQAIAETTVIQETKAYFATNGVDLESFKSNKRGDTAILVKNFPYGTTLEELRKMFEETGPVLKVLMPPTGTIAIVQFAQANHARTAFGKLAYRRIKDSVLFLEKAPRDLFTNEALAQVAQRSSQPLGTQKPNVNDLLSSGDQVDEIVETSSLFIRNLNFTTTTNGLAEAFKALDGFVSARVKTKLDPKKPGQTLSMGFGFAEFRSKAQAQAALKVMDGIVLDGHTLTVKASHKGHDAAEERRREDLARKAAAHRTKIVVKNLPFQATKKDVRDLLGTYGQLRSVRVPKKADYTSRGFAFADFVTPREAENALNALKDTHLLGRRLVLDFAEAEALDAEEEIAKMQRKVGVQVNKVALQQLTGVGRKKVNIGEDNEEGIDE